MLVKIDLDAFKFIGHIKLQHSIFNMISSLQSRRKHLLTPMFPHSLIPLLTLKSMKVELICREVNQELVKVRLSTNSRPENLIKIWLSNIP
jgi:hypothetical protein